MRLDRGFGLSLMPSLSSSSSSSVLPVDRIGGIEVRVRTRELVRRPLVRGMEEVLVLNGNAGGLEESNGELWGGNGAMEDGFGPRKLCGRGRRIRQNEIM
ncbi:hypothetical protein HanHA300_Chr14g0507191 [Helianthus annuus]|nr:hypothetical protein HanHA300_Chr14g0507191 [Helianthus annuus]KAJ0484043.1 hypothetical protein HanHA89_Chr14g0539741 [Helianthus annuus]